MIMKPPIERPLLIQGNGNNFPATFNFEAQKSGMKGNLIVPLMTLILMGVVRKITKMLITRRTPNMTLLKMLALSGVIRAMISMPKVSFLTLGKILDITFVIVNSTLAEMKEIILTIKEILRIPGEIENGKAEPAFFPSQTLVIPSTAKTSNHKKIKTRGDLINSTPNFPHKRKEGPMPKKNHLRGVGSKEQRQYKHILDEARKDGRYGRRAKEVAARTVMKHHGQKKHPIGE